MNNENTLLYNKYRPNSLSEVVGHTSIIKDLTKRSKEGTIPRVILLSGNTGIGKTTIQRILAKNILCNDKDSNGNACNVCSICKSIAEEKISNYYFEYNSSNIGIDGAREIAENADVKSFSTAKAKVFCLDEIQEMKKSPAALNNLLKPIEKDYKNVYWILGSMGDLKDIPKAITNRCTTYKLKALSTEDIGAQLYSICQKENVPMTNPEQAEVLLTIAENSYGSLRQAISYLERVIYSELWTVKEVIKELEIISNTDLIKSINALFKGDSEAFNIQYSPELKDKLRYMLGTIYKTLSGIEVPSWQSSQLKGIDRSISIDQVEYALNKLFELNKFPYVTSEIIDFALVDIFNYNKKSKNVPRLLPQPEVKRRGQI
jgi:DNA polymerase-3 subunit gamma/tau